MSTDTHIQRERERERERDRQTDTDTETQRHRDTDTETERQKDRDRDSVKKPRTRHFLSAADIAIHQPRPLGILNHVVTQSLPLIGSQIFVGDDDSVLHTYLLREVEALGHAMKNLMYVATLQGVRVGTTLSSAGVLCLCVTNADR